MTSAIPGAAAVVGLAFLVVAVALTYLQGERDRRLGKRLREAAGDGYVDEAIGYASTARTARLIKARQGVPLAPNNVVSIRFHRRGTPIHFPPSGDAA